MKRTDLLKKKNETSYCMDLSELFEVAFLKDFGKFSKGDVTYVSLPIAMKWVSKSLVSSTKEITAAAEKCGCSALLKAPKIKE